MQSAADRDLRLSYLDHFNVPVRDMNVARKFYTEVLGGVVVHEASWYLVPDRSGNGSSPGAHLDIKLFRGNGILQPYYQPWGQPSLHQVHPHGAFRAPSPEAFGALIQRLGEHHIPHLLISGEPTDASGSASASAYLRDPDMNQIEVSCTGYALDEGAPAGEFDPTVQYYRWGDWRAQVTYGGPPEQFGERGRGDSNDAARTVEHGKIDQPLQLSGVDRFTLPVRKLAKAKLFYSQVLGGTVVEENAVEAGEQEAPAVRVEIVPGVRLSLTQQPYGWQSIDTFNPHWGFAVDGSSVDAWVNHLADWGVPTTMIVRHREMVENGIPTRIEVHFTDPDGNQIELVSWDYPMNDRVERSQYNPWALSYRYDQWPPS